LSSHFDEERLLQDIVGVTIALPAHDREFILEELEALGANILIAVDGTVCMVPAAKYESVKVDDRVWCAWKPGDE
jgi:hypothetical protein